MKIEVKDVVDIGDEVHFFLSQYYHTKFIVRNT